MNPYESIGISNVINAAGKMTYLGSSAIYPDVVEKISKVAQSYVDMEELKTTVGRLLAEKVGAEDACVTSCCAAGIAISIASVLTGTDMNKIESIPYVLSEPNEIIIQKGHMVSFGANISQVINITGATIKEIGTVNSTKKYHLEGAINQKTAAVLYVVSHHAVSNGMLSLEETISSAHKYNIPVIVDAAAETDLDRYARSGADLVVFSGHKAIGGPTSGMIIGSKDRIRACQMQDKGIARMMKVGKESIMGLYFALENYYKIDKDKQVEEYTEMVNTLEKMLQDIPITTTKIIWDSTRPIPRLQLHLLQDNKYSAKDVISKLESLNPSICTRNHLADEGIIQFDPRELHNEELEVIARELKKILQ